MDRVAARDDRGADHGRRRQVRAFRVARTDADGLVGQLYGQALAICLRVGDDRLDAERAACAKHPEGDLAAIRDEHLADHQPSPASKRPGWVRSAWSRSSSIRAWPYSTASPASTRVAPTIASAGATTSAGTPSTSTTASGSPARTREPDTTSRDGWKTPTAGEVATTRRSAS